MREYILGDMLHFSEILDIFEGNDEEPCTSSLYLDLLSGFIYFSGVFKGLLRTFFFPVLAEVVLGLVSHKSRTFPNV